MTGSAESGWSFDADVVVVGAGVAGLAAALAAHRRGRKVVVLSKIGATATHFAQGGIAVVLPDTDDSVQAHVRDTLTAGAGLCDADAVRSIVSDGYRAVRDLVADGARFDETRAGQWELTREGGHGTRRIIHAGGDATGAEVQRALDHAAATLDIRRNHVVYDILTGPDGVGGVVVGNSDGLGLIHTGAVVLATGGLGHLYSATTNPEGSTGDGIALALRANVPVADIEFIQFHPTMLYAPQATGCRPLISEAVRGEGAILVDAHGDSVTDGVHPMGDLAPRDVVAGAIARRLRETGDRCVYLDARTIGSFASRFPTITAACAAAGIDPTAALIPVVPGAHYSCGGVVTDAYGRTAVPGLFAAGEVARTGMHGANRLASNSLLEGLVVGRRAGEAAAQVTERPVITDERPPAQPRLDRQPLQAAMTRWASVLRDADGLSMLDAELRSCTAAPAHSDRMTPREVEDAALTLTAQAVVAAASARTESRGCHARSDWPESDPAFAVSLSVRRDADGCEVALPSGVPC
ncbi:L-aspartate oxidase [Mycobacterium sp. CBMA271]|uniref:L-aspartate oxidase n=1 Tax=unclassified Mycobacteroides TaxID=2618759 RepID=UPI0012DBE04E|nr:MULTISPECIES: L-aspartate oxidase [unclassified Mycobacteroides]MUM18968.1 L-aspartate oxidase [Mycobacteroides sp. CBMA 326]MUM22855.1 L-aspartate oxidase [Mycobacteroides sp. CBMA 271]